MKDVMRVYKSFESYFDFLNDLQDNQVMKSKMYKVLNDWSDSLDTSNPIDSLKLFEFLELRMPVRIEIDNDFLTRVYSSTMNKSHENQVRKDGSKKQRIMSDSEEENSDLNKEIFLFQADKVNQVYSENNNLEDVYQEVSKIRYRIISEWFVNSYSEEAIIKS